jgi:hypothetical protein
LNPRLRLQPRRGAARAFREAARLDPDLAMAYWGQALVLGPNINAQMEPTRSPRRSSWCRRRCRAANRRRRRASGLHRGAGRTLFGKAEIARRATRHTPTPMKRPVRALSR